MKDSLGISTEITQEVVYIGDRKGRSQTPVVKQSRDEDWKDSDRK
jgi:hypothetical protein